MGEMQITIDCDVIHADGGTRTAAITGAFIALYQAFEHLKEIGAITEIPVTDHVAAISCGLYDGQAVLDLDYAEDSQAAADTNFVLTGRGGIVEIQGTAEDSPFSEEAFQQLLKLAQSGIAELVEMQKDVLKSKA